MSSHNPKPIIIEDSNIANGQRDMVVRACISEHVVSLMNGLTHYYFNPDEAMSLARQLMAAAFMVGYYEEPEIAPDPTLNAIAIGVRK